MPVNDRRGRPQGKCHRKQTAPPIDRLICMGQAAAEGRSIGGVRVKGWGKSPPRCRQRERHGKPHREQNRIGMARGATLRTVSGPAIRVGCARRGAIRVQDEWSPRPPAARRRAIQNPAYRPADISFPRMANARWLRCVLRGSPAEVYSSIPIFCGLAPQDEGPSCLQISHSASVLNSASDQLLGPGRS